MHETAILLHTWIGGIKGAREGKKGTREGKKGAGEGKKGAASFHFCLAGTLLVSDAWNVSDTYLCIKLDENRTFKNSEYFIQQRQNANSSKESFIVNKN